MTDIPYQAAQEAIPQTAADAGYLNSLKEIRLGAGALAFKVTKLGMWIGAEDFASAPFSVDMEGNLIASSAQIATTGTAGETLVAGNSIYLKASDGKLYKTDADADESTYSFLGFVVTGGLVNEQVTYVHPGSIVRDGLSLTPGSFYYLSGTAGAISTVPHSTRSAKVGQAISSTELRVIDPVFIRKGTLSSGGTGTTTDVTTGFYPSRIEIRAGGNAGGATRVGSSIGDDSNTCVMSSGPGGGDSFSGSYAYATVTHVDGVVLSYGTISAKSATGFTISHALNVGTTQLQWAAYS